MKPRTAVLVILAILLLAAVAMRVRGGGGFLRGLAPLIHGTPSSH